MYIHVHPDMFVFDAFDRSLVKVHKWFNLCQMFQFYWFTEDSVCCTVYSV